jgi:hypothetical protein
MPARGLVLGDMLLAQKIALETMEQDVGVANSQPCLDARPVRAVTEQPSRCKSRCVGLPVLSQGLPGPEHVDP